MITNTQPVTLDLSNPRPIVLHAVQGDAGTRKIVATILDNGSPVDLTGMTGAVAYLRSDGVRGIYDTLPNNVGAAVTVSGSTATITLVPAVLSTHTLLQIKFTSGGYLISTFGLELMAEEDACAGEPGTAEPYNNLTSVVRQTLQNMGELAGTLYKVTLTSSGTITGDKTLAEIQAAVSDGLVVVAVDETNRLYTLNTLSSSRVVFSRINQDLTVTTYSSPGTTYTKSTISLSMPGTLTFTGAVSGTYNGSQNLTLNIPTGSGDGGTSVTIDTTLTQSGQAADAKATGDGITAAQTLANTANTTANAAQTTATTANSTANTASSNASTALSRIGTLSGLTTTAKGSLVAAINEVKTLAEAGGSGGSGVVIDDTLSQAGQAADAAATGEAVSVAMDLGNQALALANQALSQTGQSAGITWYWVGREGATTITSDLYPASTAGCMLKVAIQHAYSSTTNFIYWLDIMPLGAKTFAQDTGTLYALPVTNSIFLRILNSSGNLAMQLPTGYTLQGFYYCLASASVSGGGTVA